MCNARWQGERMNPESGPVSVKELRNRDYWWFSRITRDFSHITTLTMHVTHRFSHSLPSILLPVLLINGSADGDDNGLTMHSHVYLLYCVIAYWFYTICRAVHPHQPVFPNSFIWEQWHVYMNDKPEHGHIYSVAPDRPYWWTVRCVYMWLG